MHKLGLVRATDGTVGVIGARPLAVRSGSQGSYLDVFKRPYRAQAVLAIVIVGFTPLFGAPASVVAPYVLHYVGLLGATASLKGSMFIWIGGLVGSIVAFLTIDRIGRLVSTAISAFGAFVCLVLLTQLTGHATAFVAIYVLLGALTWFGASSFWVLPTELLPTHLRARGQGLGNGLARAMVGATTWIVPAGIAAFGFTSTIIILGGCGVPLGVYALLGRRYEPKGRDLDEIAPLEAPMPTRAT